MAFKKTFANREISLDRVPTYLIYVDSVTHIWFVPPSGSFCSPFRSFVSAQVVGEVS